MLVLIGIRGILLLDIISFLVAVIILLLAHMPALERAEERLSMRQDLSFGFRYIWKQKPLLAVQVVFFSFNVVAGFSFFMVSPLILARTSSNELILASVQSAMGLGGLLGGLVLMVWGGPKIRIHGVLLSMAAYSVFGGFVLGVGQSLSIWLVAGFFMAGTVPIMNGSNQAIWQSKVPPALQGRVFATRRLIAQLSMPIAMLSAGLLADHVFEPAMMPTGLLAPVFGKLVGVGEGAGIGLMIVLSGIVGLVIVAFAYFNASVTKVETLLVDHEVIT